MSHRWTEAARDGQESVLTNMKLLTIPEVAEAIKVSEKTVRRLIKRGDLPAYKVGDRGQLRVEEQELERYVESQRVRPTDARSPNEVEPTNEIRRRQ